MPPLANTPPSNIASSSFIMGEGVLGKSDWMRSTRDLLGPPITPLLPPLTIAGYAPQDSSIILPSSSNSPVGVIPTRGPTNARRMRTKMRIQDQAQSRYKHHRSSTYSPQAERIIQLMCRAFEWMSMKMELRRMSRSLIATPNADGEVGRRGQFNSREGEDTVRHLFFGDKGW
jgi:hypothetical protein